MMKQKPSSILLFICFQLIVNISFGKTLVFSSPQGGDFKIGLNLESPLDTKKFRGSNVILLFGYTNCKSVCPFSLRTIKKAIEEMSDFDKKNIKVIFISVDNERDRSQQIDNFLKPYGPEFIGTTGSDVNLRQILSKYGARYYRYKTENNKLLVDHSSDFFIINKKGFWTHTLPFDASSSEIISALSKSDQLTQHEKTYPQSISVQLVKTKRCDLNLNSCNFTIQNENFIVELEKKSVRPQYENKFIIKSTKKTNSKIIPVEVDIEGVDTYMGYNRPRFVTNKDATEATFNLPACELKKMSWDATLIFKNSQNKFFAVQYEFQSEDQ